MAVALAALYILGSRKLDLCAAIVLYYCACILTNAYTVGYRVDASAHWFYVQQSLIDLAAIVFICYLSQFDKKITILYVLYAAIILPSMLLNGLMAAEQVAGTQLLVKYHLAYQPYSQWIDVLFAVIGATNVRRFFIRLLPFGRS